MTSTPRPELPATDAFVQLFASAPVGMAVLDGDLHCLAENDALERMNGTAIGTDSAPIPRDLLPGLDPDIEANVASVLSTGRTVSAQLMAGFTPAQPGVARAWDVTYAPIRDTSGAPVAAACTVVEISERELLAEQLRVQARRTQLLAAFFEAATDADDRDEVLHILAERATEAIGDGCVVWMRSDDPEWMTAAAIAARDPSLSGVVRRLFGTPRRIDEAISQAIVSGRSVFVPNLAPVRGAGSGLLAPADGGWADGPGAAGSAARSGRDGRRDAAEKPHGRRTATSPRGGLPDAFSVLPVYSMIEAPLRIRGEVVGSLCLLRMLSEAPRYSAEDLELAEALAARAALAIEAAQARRQLAETASTLRTALDASPLAIIAGDREFRITFWNAAAERLYGWSQAEVLGRVSPGLPDERRHELDGVMAQLDQGETIATYDSMRRTKSGDEIEVRVFAAPLHGPDGSISGLLAVHEDIRARKQLEAQLFEARKMETVGRLAGGVAHDFNNIMTAIIGFAALSEMETDDPELSRNLEAIRSAAERAAGLTRQLLAFGRRQMLNPRVLSANDAVHEIEPILRRLIGEQIELVLSIDRNAGSLHADPTQLEQVLLNLALNARDAMPDGGRLVIATGSARIRPSDLSRHAEVGPGDYVTITVSDTGVGMDDATKAHLFEPFFTTKEIGKGTGLGLATSYGIVRQSGGHIWVYSEPGRGSTFKLYFPRVADEVAVEPVPVRLERPLSGRVLLVEDEPMLRELARQVLVHHGFEVRVAANALDALALTEREPAFDLLLTDVVMPGMSGSDLALRLRERRPDLPVVLTSGYAEEIARPAGAVGYTFLGKPFTPDTLIRAVDAALGQRQAAARE